MYDIAICDDRAEDRRRLIQHINNNSIDQSSLRIHEYRSGLELLKEMRKISFAIIFLDIQMQGLDGNETAIRIREVDISVILVFYSGFTGPTNRSFEVQPFRYITKDLPDRQVAENIDAVLKHMIVNANKPVISANVNRTHLLIKAEHIIYIEKYKRSARIHITEYARELYGLRYSQDEQIPDIRTSEKMEILYHTLKKHGFGWPHDSYIVNFSYLSSCTSTTLTLDGIPFEFQITRSKSKEFLEHKKRFVMIKVTGGTSL